MKIGIEIEGGWVRKIKNRDYGWNFVYVNQIKRDGSLRFEEVIRFLLKEGVPEESLSDYDVFEITSKVLSPKEVHSFFSELKAYEYIPCLLYTSPSPRD